MSARITASSNYSPNPSLQTMTPWQRIKNAFSPTAVDGKGRLINTAGSESLGKTNSRKAALLEESRIPGVGVAANSGMNSSAWTG